MNKKAAIVLIVVLVVLIPILISFKNDEKNSDERYEVVKAPNTEDHNEVLNTDSLNTSTSVTIEQTIHSTSSEYELKGFYSPYEIVMYPIDYNPSRDAKPGTTTCQAFTVVEGDKPAIERFMEKIRARNAVNHLDANGRLILNITLGDLSSTQQQILLKSSSNSQVSLRMEDKVPSEKDAYYCFSFVNLISVK